MRRDSPPLPADGIFRAILWALMLSVVAGAVIALAGETLYRDRAISQLGGWIVIVCGALYFLFRWLGRREARRRAAGSRHDDAGGGGDE